MSINDPMKQSKHHDPLCDPKSRVVLHDRRICDCNFIARVREDERGKALDAARDAVANAAAMTDGGATHRLALAAIEALRGAE